MARPFTAGVHEVAPDAEAAWVLPLVANGVGRTFPTAEVVAQRQEYFPAHGGIAGHPARRAGEKLLTNIGSALGMVQFFGRRASETVRGYVEEPTRRTQSNGPETRQTNSRRRKN